MATPAENIATINTTLASLYSKDFDTLTFEQRTKVKADITQLERSLEFWESRQARASGSKPRVSDINLENF